MRRAGLRRIRFHDLRHSTAALLLEQGVELVVIKVVGAGAGKGQAGAGVLGLAEEALVGSGRQAAAAFVAEGRVAAAGRGACRGIDGDLCGCLAVGHQVGESLPPAVARTATAQEPQV
ncbi:hypothetical protein [Streptomyces sp. TG1A-8]|uniref:hypothetical protein n=1 Tax=Streptomyces sp. TG1A-8 TaxID=3051385 RepID=UPI0034640C0C